MNVKDLMDHVKKTYVSLGFEVEDIEVHNDFQGSMVVNVKARMMSYVTFAPFDIVIKGDDDQGCRHELKSYIGFRESYRYCTKCDHKEPMS